MSLMAWLTDRLRGTQRRRDQILNVSHMHLEIGLMESFVAWPLARRISAA